MSSLNIIAKNCLICEKSFLTNQTEIKRNAGKFCGHSCSMKHRNSLYPGSPIQVFFENITHDDNGCWIYRRLQNTGYGSVSVKGKAIAAHRFSYRELVDAIPKGANVCHKCDIKACVNPEHLFLGTSSDNRQDMIRKGRGNFPRGIRQPHAQLNEEQVSQIKLKLNRGLRQVDIAKEYNVKRNVIGDIKRNKNWYYVEAALE